MADPTVLTPPAGTRCPSCAATLRAGAPWCTLCYADLRPPPPEPPADVRPESPAPPAPATPLPAAHARPAPDLDPLTAPLEALLGLPAPTWPCATCGAANALTDSVCAACGAGFLAGLRGAEGPLLELPVVGDLGAMSRAQRLGLAAGVVLAVIALVAMLGVLFS